VKYTIKSISQTIKAINVNSSHGYGDPMKKIRKITEKIRKKKGDYVLVLKGNHKTFHMALFHVFH